MANLGRKDGIFLVRFRYQGKEYKKSLKVCDQREAEAAKNSVELTIHRLLTGQCCLPPQVDIGDFIVSGGKLQDSPHRSNPNQSIKSLVEDYLEVQKTYLAASTQQLFRYHLNNWLRHLGGTSRHSIGGVTHSELEAYLRKRVSAASETTAAKERRTLILFFRWVVAEGFLPHSPASALTKLNESGSGIATLTRTSPIRKSAGRTCCGRRSS